MSVDDAILIEALPDVVWDVTLEVERWPEWTPTVTSVSRVGSGPLGPGSVVRIKQPLQPESEWTVTAFDPGRRFGWETRRPGLHMSATHELYPEGAGTRNVLRVEARGALALLLWPLLRPAMRRALAEENRGLKTRSETLARPAPASG
jgi:hypothetical protein